jgi:hypothetical protein
MGLSIPGLFASTAGIVDNGSMRHTLNDPILHEIANDRYWHEAAGSRARGLFRIGMKSGHAAEVVG